MVDTVTEIRQQLERGREETERLLRPISDDELAAQPSPRVPQAPRPQPTAEPGIEITL